MRGDKYRTEALYNCHCTSGTARGDIRKYFSLPGVSSDIYNISGARGHILFMGYTLRMAGFRKPDNYNPDDYCRFSERNSLGFCKWVRCYKFRATTLYYS